MVKRLIPLAALAALVIVALVACGQAAPAPDPTPVPERASPPPPPAAPPPAPVSPTPDSSAAPSNGGGTAVSVKMHDVGGSGAYAFDPEDFTFTAGEAVNFTFTAETEFHTFTVDALGIDVSVDPGVTSSLSFTFDAPGTYTLICIPHEALGMVGTITVQ